MKLYSSNKHYKLYQGNMLDMREVIEPGSIDSIVTDPPYGLTSIVKRFGNEDAKPAGEAKDGSFARLSKGFMGKTWDGSGIEYNVDAWRRCYEVLKPGGYLLAFGGSRTFYRIACAIEDAGFEIRDTIMWLYGSGFPKSMALGKAIDKKQGNERIKTGKILHHAQKGVAAAEERGAVGGGAFGIAHDEEETIGTSKWESWGTALKPAFEPVIVARKPFKGSCIDNVLQYGVGGLNIDECRIGDEVIKGGTMPDFRDIGQKSKESIGIDKLSFGQVENAKRKPLDEHTGRFPSNVIFTYDDKDFQEVCGNLPKTSNAGGNITHKDFSKHDGSMMHFTTQDGEAGRYDNGYFAPHDKGSAARYFYCAKASKRDRDEGLDAFVEKVDCDRNEECYSADVPFNRSANARKNTHPTVKPTDLMQYLVRLVTPKGGVVLDPFNGSGSTGKAVMWENRDHDKDYKYIGIEMTEEYLPIARARIEYVLNDDKQETDKVEIVGEAGQLTFF